MTEYTMCGGCGATKPEDRCLGCLHNFGGGSWDPEVPVAVCPSREERTATMNDDIIKSVWAKVSGERPTRHLRWNNGVLEQKWEREIYSPNPSITHDWRPVPTTKDAPAPALRKRVKLPPIGDELYEHYPAMSAQTHADLVRDYAREAVRAALGASEGSADV